MFPGDVIGVAVGVEVIVATIAVAVAVAVGAMIVGAMVMVAVEVAIAVVVAVGVAVAVVAVGVVLGVGLEPEGLSANAMVAQVPLLIAAESVATTPGVLSVLSAAPVPRCVPLTNGTNSREVKSLGSVRFELPALMNPTYSSLLKLVVKEQNVGLGLLPALVQKPSSTDGSAPR